MKYIIKILELIRHYSHVWSVIITSLTLWWNKDLASYVLHTTEPNYDIVSLENVNDTLYVDPSVLQNEPLNTYLKKRTPDGEKLTIYLDGEKGVIYVSTDAQIGTERKPMQFQTYQDELEFLIRCPLSERAQSYPFKDIPKWPSISCKFDPKTITLDATTNSRPVNLPPEIEAVRVNKRIVGFQTIQEHIEFVQNYKQSRSYWYNKLHEAEHKALQEKSMEIAEDQKKEEILEKSPIVPATIPIDPIENKKIDLPTIASSSAQIQNLPTLEATEITSDSSNSNPAQTKQQHSSNSNTAMMPLQEKPKSIILQQSNEPQENETPKSNILDQVALREGIAESLKSQDQNINNNHQAQKPEESIKTQNKQDRVRRVRGFENSYLKSKLELPNQLSIDVSSEDDAELPNDEILEALVVVLGDMTDALDNLEKDSETALVKISQCKKDIADLLPAEFNAFRQICIPQINERLREANLLEIPITIKLQVAPGYLGEITDQGLAPTRINDILYYITELAAAVEKLKVKPTSDILEKVTRTRAQLDKCIPQQLNDLTSDTLAEVNNLLTQAGVEEILRDNIDPSEENLDTNLDTKEQKIIKKAAKLESKIKDSEKQIQLSQNSSATPENKEITRTNYEERIAKYKHKYKKLTNTDYIDKNAVQDEIIVDPIQPLPIEQLTTKKTILERLSEGIKKVTERVFSTKNVDKIDVSDRIKKLSDKLLKLKRQYYPVEKIEPNPLTEEITNQNSDTSTTLQDIIQRNETNAKRLENMQLGNITVGDQNHPYYKNQQKAAAAELQNLKNFQENINLLNKSVEKMSEIQPELLRVRETAQEISKNLNDIGKRLQEIWQTNSWIRKGIYILLGGVSLIATFKFARNYIPVPTWTSIINKIARSKFLFGDPSLANTITTGIKNSQEINPFSDNQLSLNTKGLIEILKKIKNK